MTEPVSSAYVRDLYARKPKPGAVLITITAPGLPEPIRVTDWTAPLTHGSDTWKPAAFNLTWAGAGEGEPTKPARLEVQAVGEVAELVRMATGRAAAQIDRVRVAAPGTAERRISGAHVTEAEIAGASIILTIKGRDFSEELAVGRSYSIARTPGLF